MTVFVSTLTGCPVFGAFVCDMFCVGVLEHSGLPCFRPNALRNLQARFFPELDEAGAAVKMMEIVENANQKWTTNGYDGIQWQQQGIWYWGTEKQ